MTDQQGDDIRTAIAVAQACLQLDPHRPHEWRRTVDELLATGTPGLTERERLSNVLMGMTAVVVALADDLADGRPGVALTELALELDGVT